MAVVASGQMTLTDLNDSKQLQLYISSSQPKTQIYDPNNSTYTPDWVSVKPVLTPQLFIAGSSSDIIANAKSVAWASGTSETAISSTDTNYTIGTASPFSLTINANILSSANSELYTCTVVYTDPDTGFDITTKASFEFVKVTNGQKGATGASGANAVVAILSNDTVAIPTDSSGNNGVYTGSGTDIHVYEGATELTYDGIGTANGTWKVTASASGITAGTITDSGTYATVGVASAITTDSASVTYTITGKTSNGTAISLTKVQSFSRVKSGANGTNGTNGTSPTAYWMTTSVSAISKSSTGAYTPTSLTAYGWYQTGSGAVTAYSTWYRFSESTDGTTFTVKQTSSANATSASYSFSTSGLKAIKVEMFTAGGTTTTVDTQTIPIVADGTNGTNGTNGQNAVIASVWTPQGNTIKNSSGSLTAECDVYNGSTAVTPSAFKWYIQDPTATTTSGGDTDGGNGWRLLNSTYNAGVTNYTTNTITIPASAIASVESFKCVATYNSIKYSDVCTVMDVSDPIAVSIIGGSTFKNGQGSTSLTAKLYQNGAEIDSGGTSYTYSWSLYNADGTQNTTWGTKTGKTITVNATDVSGQANLICQIS